MALAWIQAGRQQLAKGYICEPDTGKWQEIRGLKKEGSGWLTRIHWLDSAEYVPALALRRLFIHSHMARLIVFHLQK